MNDTFVKTLDCTLRDGGYINDWNFAYEDTKEIIKELNSARIDIIEIGFLDHDVKEDFEGTKFKSVDLLHRVIERDLEYKAQLVAMIMLGKFFSYEIPLREECLIDGIRVCFKKNQLNEARTLIKEIKEKGFDVYIQPASITDYEEEDIELLLDIANEIDPKAIYIVDTYGLLQKEDLVGLYQIFDKKLSKDICIGFHSHNNLQLSYANSQAFISLSEGRQLIIDACVFGMGRGAGNLCTELITRHINEYIREKYDLLKIMEIIDKHINPLFRIYTWGYSVPYYIAAMTKCHPNYASYLVEKHSLGVNPIHSILTKIPECKKRNYDEDLIKKMYIDYQKTEVNDSEELEDIKKSIGQNKVLLLAPGKKLKENKSTINNFIDTESIYTISVNFVSSIFDTNAAFFGNQKRYDEQKYNIINNHNIMVVTTSNITNGVVNNERIVNYNSLIDLNYSEPAISGAMAIRLLVKIGVEEVYLAGFDGFSINNKESFFDEVFFHMVDTETNMKRNVSFEEQLKDLSKVINIKFITDTSYVIDNNTEA